MSRVSVESLPVENGSLPFGTAYLPDVAMGVDLVSEGYVEAEFLLRGIATVWRRGADGDREPAQVDAPFCTRVLTRHPVSSDGSELLVVEPLHPDLDTAQVWNAVHPWILRGKHSWMGVTVFATSARLLADVIDGERYGQLDVAEEGLQYDVLEAAIRSAIEGSFGLPNIGPVVLAGMSATGSTCRVVLQDGFHEAWTRRDGAPLIDGYLIGISSGGAGAAGYPALSALDAPLPGDDPRRTIGRHQAIVFEVLSETEAETHRQVTRDDSDDDGSVYRLYEIAASAHIEAAMSVLTNRQQHERAGGRRPSFSIREAPSDARFDFYLRGAFEAMHLWLAEGSPPPRAERFEHLPGREQLDRDSDGNVTGGIRSPWVRVPTGTYSPHSTPSADCEPPPAWMPFSRPEMLAHLVGNMRPFPIPELRRRYGARAAYLDHFAEAVEAEVRGGLLLRDDAAELLRDAPKRWLG